MDFSPKATFVKGPHAAAWTDAASSALFREAVSAAMLQMQANLGMTQRIEEAAALHYKMDGARIFLSILMNLTTPPEERPTVTKTHNLDHKL